MARRKQPREAAARQDIRCEECAARGVIAGDIFPYLINAVPPVHRWMHSSCADNYRRRSQSPTPEVTTD